MSPLRSLALMCAGASVLAGNTFAQDALDPKLFAEISRIRAIDNHCHDDPAGVDRESAWSDDAPLGAPRYPDVVALRRDNPEWMRAWKGLYAYSFDDMQPKHLREVLGAKRALMQKMGEAWPVYVLDKANVDIALVNTTKLGSGQQGARFRWVPYADPFLWPFAGEQSRLRFNGGGGSIAQFLRDAGVGTLPGTLEQYGAQVINPTLQRWKTGGAVAIKFMVAYARGLDFAVVERDVAAGLYEKAVSGAALTAAESKALEDHLFGDVAARAGALGLVVHIHTGNGDGPFFNNGNANPSLLETAIGSRALRDTRFVLVHGGWPFHLAAQAMMDKPNTYADFSAQTFYLTTHSLAGVLREWLSWHPEKVLFGSDAYSDANTPLSDYEEKQWLAADKARRALAIALTGMMRNGEISRPRAIEIARMVMRENAVGLYHLN
jgi:uncharacterized protein